MKAGSVDPQKTQGVSRRELLQAGLIAGATLSAWPLYGPQSLWAGEAGPPKRGGPSALPGNRISHCIAPMLRLLMERRPRL